MISFTIGQSTYNGEAGQTFADWVESKYNTDGFELDNDNELIDANSSPCYNSRYNRIKSTDTIVEDGVYQVIPYTDLSLFTINIDSSNIAYITGYSTCNDTIINIPKEYNGAIIERISGQVSMSVSWPNVIKVIIPDTITTIAQYMFRGTANTTKLNTAKLPNNFTPQNIFNLCNDLTDIYIDAPKGSISYSGYPRWGAPSGVVVHWSDEDEILT